MRLTAKQDALLRSLARSGGRRMNARQATEFQGLPTTAKQIQLVRRSLNRLTDRGYLAKEPGGLYSLTGRRAPPVLPAGPKVVVPTVSAVSSLAADPWGEDVTEDRARAVVAGAVRGHLERLAKKDAAQAVREAYVIGAFMTGRPLPVEEARNLVVSAPPQPQQEADNFLRLPLPEGEDYETLWPRLDKALSQGKIDVSALADQLGLTSAMVEAVCRGKKEPTPALLERFFAATYRVI